jgi:L-iditol 2-dehydrogenase
MRSLKLTGLHKMEFMEEEVPSIKMPKDVLLKIQSVGVCGSDIHYYARGKIGSQVVKYPFAVGHECSAIVETIGSDVKKVKKSDLVAIEPGIPCGKCDQCLIGREHTCRSLKYLGCPDQLEGCLKEYIVMPESCCYKVPAFSAAGAEVAALIEPLTIGWYAAQLAGSLKGRSIAILGAGPIGLSVLFAAKVNGAVAVYVTEKIDHRKNMALKCGASLAFNILKENAVSEILKQEKRQLDFVFECSGDPSAINDGIELLKPGGSLMLVGIPENQEVSFIIDKARRKEIRLQNVRRQNRCVGAVIGALAAGLFDPSIMITHRFRFEKTPEAFDLVELYKDGVVKAMINF